MQGAEEEEYVFHQLSSLNLSKVASLSPTPVNHFVASSTTGRCFAVTMMPSFGHKNIKSCPQILLVAGRSFDSSYPNTLILLTDLVLADQHPVKN